MAEELKACLAKDPLVIFSYGGCPFCKKVTREFTAKGVAFVEIDYDELNDGEVSDTCNS